jgi:guanylate kinase
MQTNKIFAFIGTTAAGKTYYSKHLVEKYNLKYIPSVTTRPPRPGNLNEYKHVSRQQFESLVAEGEMFEYTFFNGHHYGKLCEDIKTLLQKSHCVYTITADRVKQLKQNYPDTIVLCITIEKPLIENTTIRLTERGHTKEEINRKLETIKQDIQDINVLKSEGLIDYIIKTVQGDKNITFGVLEEIAENHIGIDKN